MGKLTEEWVQDVLNSDFPDVEVVDLEEAGNRRQRIVRIFLDHPKGVTHELCARVSAVVGRALEEQGYSEGPYVLEVSSPGLERPLKKKRDFEAQLGKKVYVKTIEPVEGRKVLEGVLSEVVDEAIVITERARATAVRLDNIAKAHLVFELKPGERQ